MKQYLKRLYALIPFKKQLYSVLKSFWTPPEWLYRHLYFSGPFTVTAGPHTRFILNHEQQQIENEIFWNGLLGGWEKESLRLWMHLAANSQCILDIGANSGVYALVAQTVNPRARVEAFEPHPLFHKMLSNNVASNHFAIGCHQLAISDRDQELLIEDYSGASAEIQVRAQSLDSFIQQHQIAKVDLIKIDVETHEPKVLEGFRELLKVHRPTFLIEILSQEIGAFVTNELKGLGYLYFNIDEHGSIRQTTQIDKSDDYNYLICSPETAQALHLSVRTPD